MRVVLEPFAHISMEMMSRCLMMWWPMERKMKNKQMPMVMIFMLVMTFNPSKKRKKTKF